MDPITIVIALCVLCGSLFVLIGALGLVINPTIVYIVGTIFVGSLVAVFVYYFLRNRGPKSGEELDRSRQYFIENFKKWDHEDIGPEVFGLGKVGKSRMLKFPHQFGEDLFCSHLLYVLSGNRNAGQAVLGIVRVLPKPFELWVKDRGPSPSVMANTADTYSDVVSTEKFNEWTNRKMSELGRGGTTVNVHKDRSMFEEPK